MTLVFALLFIQEPTTEERLIQKIPEDVSTSGRCTFEPAGREAVFTSWGDQHKVRVVVHGKAGPEFDSVGDLRFSPDGKAVAYLGQKLDAEQWPVSSRACHGDSIGEEFYKIDGFAFLPDGRLAYWGSRSLDEYPAVYIDHRKQDDVHELAVSPNGRAAALLKGKKDVFVETGSSKFGPYDDVGQMVFNADGSSLAFRARRRKTETYMMVVRGREGRKYDAVSDPVWNPRGTGVAYWVRSGDEWHLIGEDGIAEPVPAARNDKTPGAPIFSLDGKYLAGVVETSSGKRVVVSGGGRSEEWDWADELQFNPKGELVYGAQSGDLWFVVVGDRKYRAPGEPVVVNGDFRVPVTEDGKPVYVAKTGNGRVAMTVGESPGPAYDFFSSPRLSSKGELTYLAVNRLENCFVIRGGKKIGPYSSAGEPVWSPDGQFLAYSATVDRKTVLFLGDRKLEGYDEIGPLTFTLDGKKLAFGARKGREIRWELIDLR